MNCKAVFAKLQKHFDDKLVVFSVPGLSSLLVFRDIVPTFVQNLFCWVFIAAGLSSKMLDICVDM